jgi:invasion protein IalB
MRGWSNMNKRSAFGIAITAALAVLLCACAATTPVASPPADALPVQAPVAATASGQQEPTPQGFRRVVRDGEEYFCQTRGTTGSRARSAEVCMTRDEIRVMEADHEKLRRDAANAASRSTFTLDSPQ